MTQGSNLGLLGCRRIPYRLSLRGSPLRADMKVVKPVDLTPGRWTQATVRGSGGLSLLTKTVDSETIFHYWLMEA